MIALLRKYANVYALIIFFVLIQYQKTDAASLYDSMQKGKEVFEQEKYDEALNAFVDAQILCCCIPVVIVAFQCIGDHFDLCGFDRIKLAVIHCVVDLLERNGGGQVSPVDVTFSAKHKGVLHYIFKFPYISWKIV